MGKRLAKQGVKPDVILSSPARRALATARILAAELDYERADIIVDDRLYAAEADMLLRIIGELGDKQKCVMLVGHNPELTELAQRFSGEITHLPTCAVGEVVFDAKSWADAVKDKPAKVSLQTPRK
jgi:phosphohistidine phosphatase